MAMQSGLYKVQFQTPRGAGYGVVALDNGELRGGDSMMYYRGKYTENCNQFTAQVEAKQHSQVPGMSSIFGANNVTISIRGTTSGNSAQLTGNSPQAPGVQMQATLTWLCP